jgi:cytochrome c oxidase subunit II
MRRWMLIPLAGALVAGCMPEPVTREGRDIAALYEIFLGIAAIVAVTVLGLASWAIFRYRARPGDDEDLPVQTHGDLRLEAAWTLIPAITILGLFALTFGVLLRIDVVSGSQQAGTELHVNAFRWGWQFTLPNEDVTVEGYGDPGPEVVLPVNEPIRVRLTAQDVIHAFYVPEFLFKRDATPGMDHVFEFTIEQEGVYRGQCAEFCGVYHAGMPFTIRAVSRPEYEAWLLETRARQPLATPASSPAGIAP